MTDDDLTRWRLHINVYGGVHGRQTSFLAIAPECPTKYHGRNTDCDCRWFDTAFEARLHIRDANRALDAENHLPDAS